MRDTVAVALAKKRGAAKIQRHARVLATHGAMDTGTGIQPNTAGPSAFGETQDFKQKHLQQQKKIEKEIDFETRQNKQPCPHGRRTNRTGETQHHGRRKGIVGVAKSVCQSGLSTNVCPKESKQWPGKCEKKTIGKIETEAKTSTTK